MVGKVISCEEVPIQKLSGRDLCMLITEEAVGAKMMSGGLLWMKTGAIVKPCHMHLDSEETVYIIKGRGRIWVDGKLFEVKTGDFAFFPRGSKHMLKNIGRDILHALFLYAPPTDPSKYEYFPDIDFPNDS